MSLIEPALSVKTWGPPGGALDRNWLSFGAALAAVAGALTGLLFVALSVKGDVASESRRLVGGVVNAWLFLVRLTSQSPPDSVR